MRLVSWKRPRHSWFDAVQIAVAVAVDAVAVLERTWVDVAIDVVAVAASERSSRRDRIGAREHDRTTAAEAVTVVVGEEQPKLARVRGRDIARSVGRVGWRNVGDVGRTVRRSLIHGLYILRASIELDDVGTRGRR